MNATPSKYLVWDLPTRLFHWTLVLLILLQWGTAEWEWLPMQWHFRFGYMIFALLVFRLLWGLVGSDTSRFARFVRGPRAALAYLRGVDPTGGVGHNPLGAWSVLALLGVLAVMVGTGLFSSEPDEFLFGPFASMAGDELSHDLTEVHELLKNVLLVLIGLHLLAIIAYAFRRRNLIGPMLSGRALLDRDPGLRTAGALRALVVLAVSIAIVWGLLAWSGASW